MRLLSPRQGWLVALCIAVSITSAPALAAESVGSPFEGGQAARVIQGPNGGTHQGRSQWALDLVLAAGGTSGAPVIAPVEGNIVWAQASGSANGCLAIAMKSDNFSVALCHVLFDHSYRRGESVARGQVIGTVGAPGTLGNNGTAHVHLELHRGKAANAPVGFGTADGLPLEGVDVPAPRAQPAPAPRPAAPAPAPNPPAPASPAAPRQTAAAPPAAPVRAAIVEGTDACLKVRAEPTVDARVVDCLPDGTTVSLSAEVATNNTLTWRQIPGQGWAATDFLRRTRAAVAHTDSCLNVRDTPSTLGAVLTCLPEGTSVTLGPRSEGDLGTWQRIEEGDGWVLADFLN